MDIESLKKLLKLDDIIDTTEPNYIDSGNYMLNVIISGDINKGVPDNRIIQFAGPESTGKTFLTQYIAKQFNKQGYNIIFFDSEGAIDLKTLQMRGFDISKVAIINVITINEFKNQAIKILDNIGNNDKFMFVVDSLGNLSSIKELEDARKDSEKKDMTRQQALKATFRMLTSYSNKKRVPILVVNHTYTNVSSFIPSQIISGGSGSKYASSATFILSKAKDKLSNGKIVGVFITMKVEKSRMVREGVKIKLGLRFDAGLSKYSGLVDFAIENNILTKSKEKGKKSDKIIFTNNKQEFDPQKKEDVELLLKLIDDYVKDNVQLKFFDSDDDLLSKEEIDDLEEENVEQN